LLYPPKAGDNRRFTNPLHKNANPQQNQTLTENSQDTLQNAILAKNTIAPRGPASGGQVRISLRRTSPWLALSAEGGPCAGVEAIQKFSALAALQKLLSSPCGHVVREFFGM